MLFPNFFSLADLEIYFWQTSDEISQHTWNASLLYVVKYLYCKNRCDSELSEANSRARLSHSKQLPHQKNPAEWPTVHTPIDQEEWRRDKKPAHIIHTYIHTNLYSAKIVKRIWGAELTFSLWWHQPTIHKWLTLHQFDTCRSRSQG